MSREKYTKKNLAPSSETTDTLVRINHDGNVALLFEDKAWAQYILNLLVQEGNTVCPFENDKDWIKLVYHFSKQHENNGSTASTNNLKPLEMVFDSFKKEIKSLEIYEESYTCYYKVIMSPQKYRQHFGSTLPPYNELKTRKENAQQILERFKYLYNRLGFNKKKELWDITSLLDLDNDFENFLLDAENILNKLNSPEYLNLLKNSFTQYSVPKACGELLISLLQEDLDQHSQYLHMEKLNLYCIHPEAKYSYDNFELLRSIPTPPPLPKFIFHTNNKSSFQFSKNTLNAVNNTEEQNSQSSAKFSS